MFDNNSATLNGKHTYYDYGLYVTNTNPVAPPTPKTQFIEIPGRNGDLDLTEALTGYTVYNNRTITLKLGGKKNPEMWPTFVRIFMNEIHGKKVKLVFDDEQEYYYIGRAAVNADYNRSHEIATFSVTVNAEPYKYSITDTTEPWFWDSFSFIDGIIQEYADLTVDGRLDYTVVGSEMPVIPEFIVTDSLQMIFAGKTYELSEGTNKIYDVVLLDQEYKLTFIGTGTVTIKYRRGRL